MLQKYVFLFVFLVTISKGLAAGIEDFAAKFQQSDYKLKVEWGQVVRFNKQYLNCFSGIVFKYNRTTAAANLTFEYKFDIGNSLELVVQAYKFASNEYRQFPLRFQMNFCFGVSRNIIGSANSFKCGNFTGCPLLQGVRHHVCNWAPDENQFPPFIPNGRYLIEVQGIYKTTEMFLMKMYGEVFRPLVRK